MVLTLLFTISRLLKYKAKDKIALQGSSKRTFKLTIGGSTVKLKNIVQFFPSTGNEQSFSIAVRQVKASLTAIVTW